MNDRTVFANMLAAESKAFENVIKAITNPEWKHPDDPKGKTAGQLAIQLAGEAAVLPTILETGILDGDGHEDGKQPMDMASAAALLHEWMEKTKQAVEASDDATWDMEANMMMGGNSVWKSTRGTMLWSMLFDMVHHRGQLSTFLRPMGSKVPSIYGPSGDDMGGMEIPV